MIVKNLLRFIRLLIPVLYYCIISKLVDEFLFLPIFLSIFGIYFFILLISLFLSKEVIIIVMIVFDSIVVCFFSIVTFIILFAMFQNVGEAGFGLIMILFYLPVYILFIVFLVIDVIKGKRGKI